MCIKTFRECSIRSLLANYKVCNFIVCVCVLLLWLFKFCEDQIFMDFVGFLSMEIYVVLYTQCLRYNICSTWFLDIRISTCYHCNEDHCDMYMIFWCTNIINMLHNLL